MCANLHVSVVVCMYANVCICRCVSMSVHIQYACVCVCVCVPASWPWLSVRVPGEQRGGRLSWEIGQEEMEDQGFTGLFTEA